MGKRGNCKKLQYNQKIEIIPFGSNLRQNKIIKKNNKKLS